MKGKVKVPECVEDVVQVNFVPNRVGGAFIYTIPYKNQSKANGYD